MNSYKNRIEMIIDWDLIPAVFVDRPNRFLTRIKINGKIHESHLPDPGRLKELLLPGVKLLVKPEDGKNRKTHFSTQAVFLGKRLISINSWLPNKFVKFLIEGRHLPFLSNWEILKSEVTEGKSRFDFQLRCKKREMMLEVKSVTLVEDGIAKFPDAVTERGTRHLNHLSEIAKQGRQAMVLFVVQRGDASIFSPQWERDPKLGEAMVNAEKRGVQIRVIKMQMTPRRFCYLGEIPYQLH